MPGATLALVADPSGGTLVVANGAGAVRFGVENLAPGAGFALAADGHGGTMLTVVR
jgi:hypothetical protein